MKKLLATIIAGALLSTGAAASAADQAPATAPTTPHRGIAVISFTDVLPGDAFYTEIQWIAADGITTGYPDGTFRPRGVVTREAVAAFLYRAMVSTTIPACGVGPRVFTDVPAGNPFCAAIEWMANQDIATGWPDHTFRPSEPVTREATAAFMYRTWYGTTLPVCGPSPRIFADVQPGNPFCGAIEALATNTIVGGWPDGTFRPSLSVERQAMAAFFYRAA